MSAFLAKIARRARSSLALVRFFMTPDRFFLVPLVLILLVAGLLLAASAGLSHVAPFVYTLF
ncbi:MAG TPA: DUF5989 family protein [Polyangiaceae bacterium]